jgi:hypothetical protein
VLFYGNIEKIYLLHFPCLFYLWIIILPSCTIYLERYTYSITHCLFSPEKTLLVSYVRIPKTKYTPPYGASFSQQNYYHNLSDISEINLLHRTPHLLTCVLSSLRVLHLLCSATGILTLFSSPAIVRCFFTRPTFSWPQD